MRARAMCAVSACAVSACAVMRACVLPVGGGCGGNGRRRAAGVRPLLALAALRRRRFVVARLHVRRALALALVPLALGRIARDRVVAAALDHLGHLHLHDLHVDVLAGLGQLALELELVLGLELGPAHGQQAVGPARDLGLEHVVELTVGARVVVEHPLHEVQHPLLQLQRHQRRILRVQTHATTRHA